MMEFLCQSLQMLMKFLTPVKPLPLSALSSTTFSIIFPSSKILELKYFHLFSFILTFLILILYCEIQCLPKLILWSQLNFAHSGLFDNLIFRLFIVDFQKQIYNLFLLSLTPGYKKYCDHANSNFVRNFHFIERMNEFFTSQIFI